MQGHYSKRFSILLLLLVLGYEFNHVIMTSALRGDQGVERLEYNDEDGRSRENVITDQENEQTG